MSTIHRADPFFTATISENKPVPKCLGQAPAPAPAHTHTGRPAVRGTAPREGKRQVGSGLQKVGLSHGKKPEIPHELILPVKAPESMGRKRELPGQAEAPCFPRRGDARAPPLPTKTPRELVCHRVRAPGRGSAGGEARRPTSPASRPPAAPRTETEGPGPRGGAAPPAGRRAIEQPPGVDLWRPEVPTSALFAFRQHARPA